MSAEYLPHIFEEFTREHTTTESKVVGTGLDLPVLLRTLLQLLQDPAAGNEDQKK